MKISVVIPVYNDEEWVEGSIESVLAQDYPDLECIVVNDRGEDRSMDIVRRMKAGHPRREAIRIAEHAKNLGLAAVRNTGIETAKGEYIFFLDADDKLQDPSVISAMAAATEKYDPDFVQGNYLRVSPKSTVAALYYNPAHPLYRGAEIADNFTRLNFTNATNKLIRKEFLIDNHIFFTNGIIYEDALWSLLVYSNVRSVATIPEITYMHNLREGSIMRSPADEHKIDSLAFITDTTCRLPKRDDNMSQQIVQNAVYAMKLLFTEDFPREYRLSKVQEILGTGVGRLKFRRAALPPFSKRLSYALSMPPYLSYLYCRALGNMYASWKMKKEQADVQS